LNFFLKKLLKEIEVSEEIAGVSFGEAYQMYNDVRRQETKAKRGVRFRWRYLGISWLVSIFVIATFPMHASTIVVYCSFAVSAISAFPACLAAVQLSKVSSHAERLNSALIDKRIAITRDAIAKARDDPMMPVDDDVLDAADRAMTTRV